MLLYKRHDGLFLTKKIFRYSSSHLCYQSITFTKNIDIHQVNHLILYQIEYLFFIFHKKHA